MTSWHHEQFEDLYSDADPYGLRTRWYEERKRAILLSVLPRRRYLHAFEPACGAGELTRALAPRCERLTASDFSAKAVAIAKARTREFPHVRVELQALPGDWPRPTDGFDLIVLSEFGYFLPAGEMEGIARCCDETLASAGTLVACDWRPPFEGRRLSSDRIHQILASLGLPRIARYVDEDFSLAVWSRDARSVAQWEGIRA